MTKRHIFSLIAFFAIVCLTSCDEDTAFIGSDVMPGNDKVSTSKADYAVTSRSIQVDSVLANTNDCYLGCIVDPETRAKTTAGFLAQFHMMENYKFPKRENMLTDEQGKVKADSCFIRIFINSYYGDSLATMKLYVQELDKNNTLEENTTYYSNINPNDFINPDSYANTSLAYAIKDLSRPDSLTDGDTYYRSIVVKLPAEYGSHILNSYYENPEYFKNSYQFIHNVCPGFNFQTVGTIGSMLNVKVSALDVYFSYKMKNEQGNDSIYDGMHRMAATEEVIQNSYVENKMPESMLNDEYTYIKSPAGIYTEITLPVAETVAGEHYTDTINSAQITIRRYQNTVESDYHIAPPTSLLMVRKNDVFKFFEKVKLPDGKESFLSTYDPYYNAYQFTNIGQLITIMKLERDKGAGVNVNESEDVRNEKYAKWEAENPDWNKVLLVPVKADYTTTSGYYGTTTQSLLRVRNHFGLSSARLEGGKSSQLKLTVVYSSFD